MRYRQGPSQATSSHPGPQGLCIALTSGTSHGLGPHVSDACPVGPGSPESPSLEWVSRPPTLRPQGLLSFSAPATQGQDCHSGLSPCPHPRDCPRTEPTCLYRKDWLSNSSVQNCNLLGTQVPVMSRPQGSPRPVWPQTREVGWAGQGAWKNFPILSSSQEPLLTTHP